MKKGKSNTTSNDQHPTTPELTEQFLRNAATEKKLYRLNDLIAEPRIDPMSQVETLKQLGIPDLRYILRRYFPRLKEQSIKTVADDVFHSPALPFGLIKRLVTVPTFLPDFTLITKPGFDEKSGIYYSPDIGLRDCEFSADAGKEKALESLRTIEELLQDFPFLEEAGRFNWIAFLLTLFLRGSISGTVPALAIDGNGQSLGKGLLGTIISMIVFGQDAPNMSMSSSATEFRAELDGVILKGAAFQVIDNVIGKVANSDLASTMTATRRTIRIKGTSKVVDAAVDTVWIFNGNGISFDSDMAQRVVTCKLQHEDPTSRRQETFHIQVKYGMSIPQLLTKDRAKYIQACLYIIGGWVNAGSPLRKHLVMAKYGSWESIIGGIIDWIAPEAEFLRNHRQGMESMDEEKGDAIQFLRHVMKAFPSCGVRHITASQIKTRIFSPDSPPSLRDSLPAELSVKSQEGSFTKRLGHWLKLASTKALGDIEVIAEKDAHEGSLKYVIRCKPKKTEKAKLFFEEEADADAA